MSHQFPIRPYVALKFVDRLDTVIKVQWYCSLSSSSPSLQYHASCCDFPKYLLNFDSLIKLNFDFFYRIHYSNSLNGLQFSSIFVVIRVMSPCFGPQIPRYLTRNRIMSHHPVEGKLSDSQLSSMVHFIALYKRCSLAAMFKTFRSANSADRPRGSEGHAAQSCWYWVDLQS